MKTRLSPHYISLVYEVCLKSFWRKKSLSKFLRQCRVSETFINSWAPGETKRDFLDRLFDRLPTTDSGRKALLDMSFFLMEQSSFPDLHNWEDSEQKIKAAQDAVSKLRAFHSKQQDELQSHEDRESSARVCEAPAASNKIPAIAPGADSSPKRTWPLTRRPESGIRLPGLVLRAA